jgi:hypothetical protein
MKDRTGYRYCMQRGVLAGRGRVNRIEEGEAIYLMGFIYIYKIEQ